MRELTLVRLKNMPILQQLQLEEALLRTDHRDFCLINQASTPAIVMGISGKAEELIHLDAAQAPIIKRFSGGGTVVVDQHTLFVTLMGQHEMLPCKAYPREIMQWTRELYQPVFGQLPFELREHDYTLGEKKFGGNAQSLTKDRWLHHSSFLWDYNPERMAWLKLPKRQPKYRGQRSHADFLCCLKEYFVSLDALAERFETALAKQFVLRSVDVEELLPALERCHRRVTTELSTASTIE